MTITAEALANALMLAERVIQLERLNAAPTASDFVIANRVRAECSVALKCIAVAVKEAA